MLDVLWLIPAWPMAGFLILALAGRRLPREGVATIGVGSVGLSGLASIVVAVGFIASPPPGEAYSQSLWLWMSVAGFAPRIGLYLDALSLVMVVVVAVVGFMIHLYSVEFMTDEEGYSRF